MGHQCKSVGDINQYLNNLGKPKKAQSKPSYQMFLNDLEEIDGQSQSTLNPTYLLHLMIQDSQGKIYDDQFNLSVSHVKRSLAEILGLASQLAKREKENEIGRSAAQMLKLLLDTMGHNQKRSAEVRRVSLQHFLNELLVNATTTTITAGSNKDDATRVFFGLTEIEGKLNK